MPRARYPQARIQALILALSAILLAGSVEARDSEKWIGKPITLKTANADVGDLLRLIAGASGFNLVLGDGVQGNVRALDWQDVPWDQALEMILKTKHLHAERNGNMLRIVTNDEFLKEQQEQAKARDPDREPASVQIIRH